MESVVESLLTNPTVIAAVFVGASVLILVYIAKLFRKEDVVEHKVKNEKSSHPEKKKDTTHSGKVKKKVVENRWTGRNEKQAFAHPWLLTSLKGHTGTILDMNFSSNGKYLTSCGDEDRDPSSSSSSSSECNKENRLPPSLEPRPGVNNKGLSRRQRKNRKREDSPPIEKPRKQKSKKKVAVEPPTVFKSMAPLKQYVKLNVPESVFIAMLQGYMLTYNEMKFMGYPMESSKACGVVEIHKLSNFRASSSTTFDVNATEFVPRRRWISNSSDSGHGSSGSSSDSGENCDSEESSSSSSDSTSSTTTNNNSSKPSYLPKVMTDEPKAGTGRVGRRRNSNAATLYRPTMSSPGFRRTCSRCSKTFFTTEVEYLTMERCCYHWGRLRSAGHAQGRKQYTCCEAGEGAAGCTSGQLHVWDGLVEGANGPFYDYVRMPQASAAEASYKKVYALDCEMCYTVRGFQLAKVSVVGMDGELVYDKFVLPECDVVDYNTRFSGITSRDLCPLGGAKSLRDVQKDLMQIITSETVLIGHALENDLRALKIVHDAVVDTACCFPHYRGLPYKRSLRNLTSSYLDREIQCGDKGHDSYEDACACMELMLWRCRKDLRRSHSRQ